MLEEHPKLLLSNASVKHGKDNLYMQAPPVLEKMHRPNLSKPLYDLMGRVQKDTIHVFGTALKNEEKQSSLTKLRVVFKGADGVADMDTAIGA